MFKIIRQSEIGILVLFFAVSAMITLTMSLGFIIFSAENSGILPGGETANREYAELLPLMITGYYAGAIGALCRYGIDREAFELSDEANLYRLKKSAVFRLLIGGLFGVVSYLLLQSNLLIALLFDTSRAVGGDVPTVPVSVAGVLIVGFFVGVFSSEVFGSLKARFDADDDK